MFFVLVSGRLFHTLKLNFCLCFNDLFQTDPFYCSDCGDNIKKILTLNSTKHSAPAKSKLVFNKGSELRLFISILEKYANP